jgi:hypothetical protein
MTQEPAALADGINLVLAGRTSELSVLPFSSRILSAIKSRLHIHKSIFRAVNRNASCTFSKFPFEWKHGNSKRSSIGKHLFTYAVDLPLSVAFSWLTSEVTCSIHLSDRGTMGRRRRPVCHVLPRDIGNQRCVVRLQFREKGHTRPHRQ